jgi:hypothetical protein
MPRYFFQVSNGESAFETKWASKPENYRGWTDGFAEWEFAATRGPLR